MPSLHETYATLVRRGMPEHRMLDFAKDAELVFYRNGWVAIAKTDAHDLLTMHALRWVMDRCAFPGKWLTIDEHMARGRGIAWREEATDSYELYVAVCEGFHKTILDAIVVATKHLEPK